MFPSNEAETIALYKLAQDKLPWHIVHLQTAFPDAIIENRNGQRLVVEFEYLARNFKTHKHDAKGCDLIVCWQNNWDKAPLSIWELGKNSLCVEMARTIEEGLVLRLSTIVKSAHDSESYWRERAERAEAAMNDDYYEPDYEELWRDEREETAKLKGLLEGRAPEWSLVGRIVFWWTLSLFAAFLLGALATIL